MRRALDSLYSLSGAAAALCLAGIGVLWFAVLFAGSRYVGRNIARNARMTSESRSQLVGRMADAIINIRNVLQFAHQPHEIEGLAARENAVVNREQYAYLTILDVRMFNQVMSLDRDQWNAEILQHEELFIKLYDRLPKEMLSIRDLILSAVWRSPEHWEFMHYDDEGRY